MARNILSPEESMKRLSEKVIKADLVSRKAHLIGRLGVRNVKLLQYPIIFYAIYVYIFVIQHLIFPGGNLHHVERQAGKDINVLYKAMSLNNKGWRETFRPGKLLIYNNDRDILC